MNQSTHTQYLANGTAPEHVIGIGEQELELLVDSFKAYMDELKSGSHDITNVFAKPDKSDVVRLNGKVKQYVADHGWMAPDEAQSVVASWAAHADSQYKTQRTANSERVVLSLFDLSGKWAEPWARAGYQVYTFDIQDDWWYEDPQTGEMLRAGDVHNFSHDFFNEMFGYFEGADVYAILAACPCTDFAVSGARHFAAKDVDGRTVASVNLVQQTLAVIEYFKPAIWAIENPVGRIEKLGNLPPWRLSFDPYHFGEDYTKRTLLWGRFNADLPIAPCEPTEGSKMHKKYGGKSMATKNARSVTPEGFSYAFFMANNAHDHPALELTGVYDRLDANLITAALDNGVSAEEIHESVMDFYYQDYDDEAGNAVLAELAGLSSTPTQLSMGF